MTENFEILVKQIINECREKKKFITPALTSFIVETLYNKSNLNLSNFSQKALENYLWKRESQMKIDQK